MKIPDHSDQVSHVLFINDAVSTTQVM